MLIQIEVEGKKGLVKESDNLVDAFKEFNPKKVKSVVYTEGDITTFAVSVKANKGYTLKVTSKYNNRTGEFEYV